MNIIDLAIAVLLLGFVIAGIAKGFLRQAISLAGLVAAFFAAAKYYAWAREFLHLDFPGGEAAGFLAVLLAVYLAVRLVGVLVDGWVRGSKLSAADRFFGALAGFLKGGVFSVLLVLALVLILPRDAKVMKESRLAPKALSAAGWLEKAIPERVREAVREKLRSVEPHREEKEKGPAPPPQPKKRPRK